MAFSRRGRHKIASAYISLFFLWGLVSHSVSLEMFTCQEIFPIRGIYLARRRSSLFWLAFENRRRRSARLWTRLMTSQMTSSMVANCFGVFSCKSRCCCCCCCGVNLWTMVNYLWSLCGGGGGGQGAGSLHEIRGIKLLFFVMTYLRNVLNSFQNCSNIFVLVSQ